MMQIYGYGEADLADVANNFSSAISASGIRYIRIMLINKKTETVTLSHEFYCFTFWQ